MLIPDYRFNPLSPLLLLLLLLLHGC